MKKKILITQLILGLAVNVYAQTKSQNNNIWFHYLGKNLLSKNASLTLEASLRYANGFSEKQQYFVRPSIDYQLSKALAASVGFTRYNTFVYGSPAINMRPIPENHIWVEANFTNQFRDLIITNRLRDENRWVGIAALIPNTTDYQISEYKYRNRFRYMFTATYPLIKKDKKPLLNAIVGDEAFVNIGPKGTNITKNNVGKTLMNQNRIIIGLGYILNKFSQIQVSYIQQNIWNFSDTIEESNPTLRVSYLTNLRLYK